MVQQKVAVTVMEVVADLQTSISAHVEVTHSNNGSVSATAIDRRRHHEFGLPSWRGRQNDLPFRKLIGCHCMSCWSSTHLQKGKMPDLCKNSKFGTFVTDNFNTDAENQDLYFKGKDPLEILEDLAIHITDSVHSTYRDDAKDLVQDENPFPFAYLTILSKD